jgi:penicillin-insensitive murein DD-endopeptidase
MRRIVCLITVAALLVPGLAEARKTKKRAPRNPCTAGYLRNGKPLPDRGDGYVIPRTWAERGNVFGTAALIGLVQRVGRRLHKGDPDATLYVADLSPEGGGPSSWHRSHKNGRDVDLIFYAVDGEGNLAPAPDHMIRFDDDGGAVASDGTDLGLRFDTRRNWQLVRALVTDRSVAVTNVFIYAPLRRRLLLYAVANDEPASVIRRAAQIMSQPSDSSPHDDHMHIRIACQADPPHKARTGKSKSTKSGKAQGRGGKRHR